MRNRLILSLVALACFLCAPASRAGYTIVQSRTCNSIGQGVPVPCAFPSSVTSGNAVVVITYAYGPQAPLCVPSDNQLNVYHSGGAFTNSGTPQITMWAAFSLPGGIVTVTTTCNALDYPSADIFEVHGTFTNLVDQNNGIGSTGISNNTGNITTTAANEIIFSAGLYVKNNVTTCASSWTDSGGWTPQLNHCDPEDLSTSLSGHSSVQIVTVTGTYSNTIAVVGLANPGSGYVVMISSFSFGSGSKKHKAFIIKSPKVDYPKGELTMADEFNPDPWNHTNKYIDRTYPSGVARERPLLTTRIHCEPDSPGRSEDMVHDQTESAVERFNRALRSGIGTGRPDESSE